MSRLAKKLAALAVEMEEVHDVEQLLGRFIHVPGLPHIYQSLTHTPGYYDNCAELVDHYRPSKTLEQLIKRMLKAKRNNEKQSG